MRDGFAHWCITCSKKAIKPVHSLYGRLRFRHGMSYEDYLNRLKSQNNVCAICSSPTPGYDRRLFCVDHDHRNGNERGLLCYACNLGLGKFKDDVQLLENAVTYLKKYEKSV